MSNFVDIDASLDVISENSKLAGDFEFGKFSRINGSINGNIKSLGTITVGEKARLKTNIVGVDLIVNGEIIGDLIASNSISLGSTAKILGNINTPKLSIKNGAHIEGKINMLNFYQELNLTNIFG